MYGYFDCFPEKAKTELRTATFVEDDCDSQIPNGTYLFAEYFCENPQCDCRRMLVKVFRVKSESDMPTEVATISYTWDTRKKGARWAVVTAGMPNPFLDPFHRQASYAPELLEFWSFMVERDSAYKDRIVRHYHELRSAFEQTGGTPWKVSNAAGAPELTRRDRRARQQKLKHHRDARKRRSR